MCVTKRQREARECEGTWRDSDYWWHSRYWWATTDDILADRRGALRGGFERVREGRGELLREGLRGFEMGLRANSKL